MPPPAEALQLKAALGDAAFASFKAAKNRYRDGDGLDAQGFLTAFYGLTAADDGLAARADSLLSLATALLPPARRGALRDPTLRGRARTAAAAQQASRSALLSVTLKSLQHPATELELHRDQRVEELRARICRGTTPALATRAHSAATAVSLSVCVRCWCAGWLQMLEWLRAAQCGCWWAAWRLRMDARSLTIPRC
jgi:hypothetical protein